MPKRLNLYGKLLHAFTAFFPMYVYWAYFFLTKVSTWSISNILQLEYLMFILFSLLSLSSILIFYGIILKKVETPDKEFNIKSTEKKSSYIKYMVGSLSPFILFLGEFINNKGISLLSIIVGTAFFIIIGLISIIREETGILYNLFYIPYNILNAKTKEGKEVIIISNKNSLTGYTKTFQLDKKVFKEWT